MSASASAVVSLTGVDTYTGGTTLTAGTLELNGTASIPGALSASGGISAPGYATPGTISTGAVDLAAGAEYESKSPATGAARTPRSSPAAQ